MEKGEITTSGFNLRALVSAYYKLANYRFEQGLPEQALATYGKITEISPHYAEVHYNLGIVFRTLAQREANPKKKQKLLNRAREEFQLQTQYDWHRRAAKTALKALAELLRLQPKSHQKALPNQNQ